jgi:hypothetical protein
MTICPPLGDAMGSFQGSRYNKYKLTKFLIARLLSP